LNLPSSPSFQSQLPTPPHIRLLLLATPHEAINVHSSFNTSFSSWTHFLARHSGQAEPEHSCAFGHVPSKLLLIAGGASATGRAATIHHPQSHFANLHLSTTSSPATPEHPSSPFALNIPGPIFPVFFNPTLASPFLSEAKLYYGSSPVPTSPPSVLPPVQPGKRRSCCNWIGGVWS
jgi:hypothetical protein